MIITANEFREKLEEIHTRLFGKRGTPKREDMENRNKGNWERLIKLHSGKR